ncbi:B3 domain-containing protein Os01g0234100-like [Euphorbia lathyris]|uniref:B3 domain-containing protein Os01g0234100-like n=1 Tax=Euphorbia lathyris TaxID=212925 RepID=UPI003314391C
MSFHMLRVIGLLLQGVESFLSSSACRNLKIQIFAISIVIYSIVACFSSMAVPGIKQTAKRGRPRKDNLSIAKTSSKQVISYNQMKEQSQKRKRSTNDSACYDEDQTKCSVMKRAEEVQAKLAPQLPSVIKYMLPSHVTGGFWLGLPKQFCDKHMPKQDTIIVLEDENGVSYKTKYLTTKVGLSGGWRGFSMAHNLVEGDVVVFQLVMPTKLKVYIVRANGSDELDGALGLLELEALSKQLSYKNPSEELEESISLLMCNPDSDNDMNNKLASSANSGLITDHSDYEVLDGIRLSDSVVDFNEVKSFEDFEILTNGLVISTELTQHFQRKYYDLCCSKKTYLHENLLGGLNCKLAAGVIAETINIADAIRASKPTTPDDSFTTWRKTLKAFKTLGMNVDFVQERLDQLVNVAAKSRKYEEVKTARDIAEEEMKNLEKKVMELKEVSSRLDEQLTEMKRESEYYDILFEQVAKAPW